MAKTTKTKTTLSKPKAATLKTQAQPRSGGPAEVKAGRQQPPRQPGVERRKNHPSRAKHGYIELILTQAMPQLGQPGDLVKVRPGFAPTIWFRRGWRPSPRRTISGWSRSTASG